MLSTNWGDRLYFSGTGFRWRHPAWFWLTPQTRNRPLNIYGFQWAVFFFYCLLKTDTPNVQGAQDIFFREWESYLRHEEEPGVYQWQRLAGTPRWPEVKNGKFMNRRRPGSPSRRLCVSYSPVCANVVPRQISKPSAWYIFSSHGAQHTVRLAMPFCLHHVCAACANFRAIPLPRNTGSI